MLKGERIEIWNASSPALLLKRRREHIFAYSELKAN